MSNRVQISEDTYKLLRGNPNFKFEMRGLVKVHGIGDMTTYIVSRPDPDQIPAPAEQRRNSFSEAPRKATSLQLKEVSVSVVKGSAKLTSPRKKAPALPIIPKKNGSVGSL